MDTFFGLFFAMGCNSMFFDNWSPDFDIIGALPLEVAVIVLRNLDGESLLNAAQVSRKWLRIIKFDRVLRRTVREELARRRLAKCKRQMFLSESANVPVHMAACFPEAKKQRRTFEKSIRVHDKPAKKKTRPAFASTAQLRNFR